MELSNSTAVYVHLGTIKVVQPGIITHISFFTIWNLRAVPGYVESGGLFGFQAVGGGRGF